MSNDMISVPRELLERISQGCRFTLSSEQYGEISALLAQPVEPADWAAPKTVRQLIVNLSMVDPDLEVFAMLRVPDFKDGKQVRAIPLSASYERVKGQWLVSYKGDGRKVLAFWSNPPTQAPVMFPSLNAKLSDSHDWDQGYRDGWNACIDEFKRLNPTL